MASAPDIVVENRGEFHGLHVEGSYTWSIQGLSERSRMSMEKALLLVTGTLAAMDAAQAGAWHFDRRTDTQTGERALSVSVTSSSLLTTQGLVVRCARGTLDAYVSFGEHLGNEPIVVKYQIDQQAVVEEKWLPSAKGTAVFAGDDREFVLRLLHGKTLVIDVTDQGGQSHKATFDIANGELALGEVLNKCRTADGQLRDTVPNLRPEIAKDLERWGPKTINLYKRALIARNVYSGEINSTIEAAFALAVQKTYDDYLQRCKQGRIDGSIQCDLLRQSWERGASEPLPPPAYLIMHEEAPAEIKAEAGKLSAFE